MITIKAKILSLLRESSDYVSGQELCEKYGVSRTAVWKAVGQLKKEGYPIEAVRNKGYRLLESASTAQEEIYGQNELSSRMHTKWVAQPVCFYDCLGSTNVQAKRMAEEGAAHGTLVVTDMQTAGRGRRGHGWVSPAGTNVYFTLILKPDFATATAPMLTLVMAIAVAQGIEATIQTRQKAQIKWPNDIVMNGRKVCGILTEMSLSVEQDCIQYVVIGVGINVKKQEFVPELADKATTLCEVCGREISRSELIFHVMERFEKLYEEFAAAGDLSGLQQTYNDLLVNKDREVCVLDPAGEYRGVARGIDEKGQLLVELPDETVQTVYAGEVSVRGIYGYV